MHWPAEAERLDQLRSAGTPRLVIVADGRPPVVADALEDWLRAPADEEELATRLETLRIRADAGRREVRIEDGVLHVGPDIVVLPPIQSRLAEALVERMDSVVGRELLNRRAWPEGAPSGRNVLDVHMAKLRRLLVGTGLDVRTVHRRGYLMHQVPVHETSGPEAQR